MKKDLTQNITTEQLILATAEKLFLEKGYSLTSTTEIAKIAGCNQALVHYYFRTKDRLFDAVFEKHSTIFISSLLQRMEDHLSFEEKVRKKVEIHFDVMMANPGLPFLFFNEINTNPGRFNQLKVQIGNSENSFISQIESELNLEIEKGAIRPMTATGLLLTILSMNLGLFIAGPFLKTITTMQDSEYQNLMDHRKRENTTVILKSLRPE